MLPGRSSRERAISADWIRGSTSIATRSVIRSWKSKTSAGAPSKCSAQRCAPVGAVDQLRGDPQSVAGPPHAAFEHVAHTEVLRHLPHVDGAALVDERRVAGDHREARNRLSAVMMSSTTPSANQSCPGSPPRLAKGRTARAGLAGTPASVSLVRRPAAQGDSRRAELSRSTPARRGPCRATSAGPRSARSGCLPRRSCRARPVPSDPPW